MQDPKSGSLFGKKFRMNFPKKLGRTSVEVNKPVVAEEKAEDSDKSSEKEDKIVEDNFYGVIQKIRNEYEEVLQHNPEHSLNPGINPSLPNETPVLKLPPFTTIIIQEDRPEAGGVEDLYRGTIRSVGQDASIIEKVAPMWLGDLVLRVCFPTSSSHRLTSTESTPNKRHRQSLLYPSAIPRPTSRHRWTRRVRLPLPTPISNTNIPRNSRLNANRMLRAKKILGYVTERIDTDSDTLKPDALKPEEYLELYCQNQVSCPQPAQSTALYSHPLPNITFTD